MHATDLNPMNKTTTSKKTVLVVNSRMKFYSVIMRLSKLEPCMCMACMQSTAIQLDQNVCNKLKETQLSLLSQAFI